MKTKLISKFTLVLMVIAAICFAACQKEKSALKTATKKPAGKSIFVATSSANIEFLNALFNLGAQKTKNPEHKQSKDFLNPNCATVTYDTVDKPHVATFNFGTGCVGGDGHLRSGEYTITYDNSDLKVVNDQYVITFSNFYLDTNQLFGSLSFVNNGYNNNGNLTFTETTGGGSISPGGSIDSVVGTIYYEWTQGINTSPYTNLQFQVTGGGCQTDNSGNTQCVTIETPLTQNSSTTNNCNFISSGTILIQTSGQANETIDYGNPGGCTGMATITQNGSSQIIPQINTPF